MFGTATTQRDAQNAEWQVQAYKFRSAAHHARHLISVPKGLEFFPNKYDLQKVL
jgi:hypothetical protein